MTSRSAKVSRRTGLPKSREPIEIVREYIARINAGDSAGLAELASANLRFVDATGGRHRLTRDGWLAYFRDFPDYRMQVEEMLSRGEFVAVFGVASGSFKGCGKVVPGAAWRFPAAWRALVRSGKLVEWRVYGDVEAMLRSAGQNRFD